MEWLASVRKRAQEAVNSVVNSEAAELARQLAAQATEQATAFAKEAKVKAEVNQLLSGQGMLTGLLNSQSIVALQAVAKEALSEAEKGLKTTLQASKPQTADPLDYGITPDLEQFVGSLTYSTFSDYPLDSLDIPTDAAEQKLSSWQETHARLVLEQVPQLQDLRFVMCPKRMDEFTFWTIYFTLCKRYLPTKAHPDRHQQEEAAGGSGSSTTGSRQAATAGVSSRSASAQQLGQHREDAPAAAGSTAGAGGAAGAAAAVGAAAAAAAADDVDAAGVTDDDLAELANDPELDAYLEDALQLDGDTAAGDSGEVDGSELEDLDDYINKLDAEVS